MIVINNAIVRENDVVAHNLVLEEITRQGIILRYGNRRFRLDAQ
ncbi:MAG: general secretion pathway protein GspB [Desulfopila sp.]